MKIVREFGVDAPADGVWEFFQDVPKVAACVPGAELMGIGDDGSYEGRVSFKMGPMTASFDGSAVLDVDSPNRTARMAGRGRDKSGGSRGKIAMAYRIVPAAEGCIVDFEADITLQGPIAQIGRQGLIDEVASRLIDEFVACVESTLNASGDDQPSLATPPKIGGFGLLLASAWTLVVRFFSRLGRRDDAGS